MDAERIYSKGWLADDFVVLAPNSVIVSPVRAPESIGRIITSHVASSVPGSAHLMYRVEVVGPVTDDTSHQWVVVKRSDIIVVRNQMLESLHPDGRMLTIERRHVRAIVHSAT